MGGRAFNNDALGSLAAEVGCHGLLRDVIYLNVIDGIEMCPNFSLIDSRFSHTWTALNSQQQFNESKGRSSQNNLWVELHPYCVHPLPPSLQSDIRCLLLAALCPSSETLSRDSEQ